MSVYGGNFFAERDPTIEWDQNRILVVLRLYNSVLLTMLLETVCIPRTTRLARLLFGVNAKLLVWHSQYN